MKLLLLKSFFLVTGMILTMSCANKSTASESDYKNEIRKTIAENLSRIQQCYVSAIKVYPVLQGKIRTLFKINSNGEVVQAKITSSTANNAQLEECVIKELRALKFSKNKEVADSEVDYPFDFRPSPS